MTMRLREVDWIGLGVTALSAGLLGYLVGSPTSYSIPGNARPGEKPPVFQKVAATQVGDLDLSPREVVEEQMRSLSVCRHQREASARVFSLASPANKAVTGPLKRFERMIWHPPFNVLIVNRGWSIGKVVQRDNVAAVLVLVVQPSGESIGFRFYLSQQGDNQDGRWMTDAVIPRRTSPGNRWMAGLPVNSTVYL